MKDLEHAIILATQAHEGQVDKAGQPYILHPLRVMLAQKDDKHRIVGVLHDVVEDTYITMWAIDHEFGEPIARAVDALTRRDGESYDAYLSRVALNPIAAAVKIADIRDNMDPSRGVPVNPKYAKALAFLEAAQ